MSTTKTTTNPAERAFFVCMALLLISIAGTFFTGCPSSDAQTAPVVHRAGVSVDTNGVIKGPTNFVSANQLRTISNEWEAVSGNPLGTIDWSAGTYFHSILNAHVLGGVPFANIDPGKTIVLRLSSITGNWNMTWPGTVSWINDPFAVVTNNTSQFVAIYAESAGLQYAQWLNAPGGSGGGGGGGGTNLVIQAGSGIAVNTNGLTRTIYNMVTNTDTQLTIEPGPGVAIGTNGLVRTISNTVVDTTLEVIAGTGIAVATNGNERTVSSTITDTDTQLTVEPGPGIAIGTNGLVRTISNTVVDTTLEVIAGSGVTIVTNGNQRTISAIGGGGGGGATNLPPREYNLPAIGAPPYGDGAGTDLAEHAVLATNGTSLAYLGFDDTTEEVAGPYYLGLCNNIDTDTDFTVVYYSWADAAGDVVVALGYELNGLNEITWVTNTISGVTTNHSLLDIDVFTFDCNPVDRAHSRWWVKRIAGDAADTMAGDWNLSVTVLEVPRD